MKSISTKFLIGASVVSGWGCLISQAVPQASIEVQWATPICNEDYAAVLVMRNIGTEPISVVTDCFAWSESHFRVVSTDTNISASWADSNPRSRWEIEYLRHSNDFALVQPGSNYIFDAACRKEGIVGPQAIGTNEVYMEMYLGGGQWVTSDVRSVVIFPRPATIPVLFSGAYVLLVRGYYGPEIETNNFTVGRVEYGGDNYLYNLRSWTRFCRIPPGASFRFEMDEASSVLTVHFDGTQELPLVFMVRMQEIIQGSSYTTPLWYWVQQKKQELGIP